MGVTFSGDKTIIDFTVSSLEAEHTARSLRQNFNCTLDQNEILKRWNESPSDSSYKNWQLSQTVIGSVRTKLPLIVTK